MNCAPFIIGALLLATMPALAQSTLVPTDSVSIGGTGIGVPASGIAISSKPSVVAPAYTPNGLAFLQYNGLGTNSALGVTNSKTLTYSFWLMGTYDNTNDTTLIGNETWSDTATLCEVTGGTAKGLCNSIDTNAGRFQFNFNDSTGTVSASNAIKFVGQAQSNGVWHHYLVSMDTLNQVSALYYDGVNSGVTASPLPANILPDLNNSAGFHIAGTDTAQPAVSMQYQAEIVAAEASIVCTGAGAPTTMNSVTVTCSGANTIPPEVLSKFISGGLPVDLGSGCATPFGGRQAEVCLRGSTTNTGSGGSLAAFVTTASYGSIPLTPYGPGGIPSHQATMRWLQAKKNATVTTHTMTTSAGSMPVASGDLIVIFAGISNSSGSTNWNLTCPSGFTQIGPVNETFESTNQEVCYKILVGGDTSGAYVIGWDSGGGVRGHDWVMMDYANVASVDQHDYICNGANSKTCSSTTTTSHKTAAGLTTTSANETVLSCVGDWDAAANTPWSPPGTGTLRYRVSDVGSPLQLMCADEYAVASGSNPQRTFTSGSAVTSAGFTLTMVPN